MRNTKKRHLEKEKVSRFRVQEKKREKGEQAENHIRNALKMTMYAVNRRKMKLKLRCKMFHAYQALILIYDYLFLLLYITTISSFINFNNYILKSIVWRPIYVQIWILCRVTLERSISDQGNNLICIYVYTLFFIMYKLIMKSFLKFWFI